MTTTPPATEPRMATTTSIHFTVFILRPAAPEHPEANGV
jgi:hypothetical protein